MRLPLTTLALVVALAGALSLAQPAVAQPPSQLDLTQRNVQGTLDGGGSFVGEMTISSLGYDQGQLLANGTLGGQATLAGGQTRHVSTTFTGTPLGLTNAGTACDSVDLDLGPISLPDVGATVDPSPFNVDLATNPTASNLICAASRLVELADQGQPVQDIINSVLNVVNEMLPGGVIRPPG